MNIVVREVKSDYDKLKSVEIIIHSFKTAVICNIPLSFTSEIFKRIKQIFFIYPVVWRYFTELQKGGVNCMLLTASFIRLTSPGIIRDLQEYKDEI